MKSSLPSKANRSLRHLRWSATDEGWGGDQEVTLSELSGFTGHVEWVEGTGSGWNVWVFSESTLIDTEDILIDPSQDLAMKVDRITTFTNLTKGTFHHYEIVASVHPKSVAELDAALSG